MATDPEGVESVETGLGAVAGIGREFTPGVFHQCIGDPLFEGWVVFGVRAREPVGRDPPERSEKRLLAEWHRPFEREPGRRQIGPGATEDEFVGFHQRSGEAAQRAESWAAKRPTNTVRNAGETKAASKALR